MPKAPFDDPHAWFDAWFTEASQRIEIDPNAMTLSSVSATGQPAARVVLLKEWDERGFVFYTNRRSRKGAHLADQPQAALSFYWRELRRQIRIEGKVEQVPDEQSDAYFATRPRLSQIGAWASLQSQPLAERGDFEVRVAEFEAKYANQDVPRPPHWGGYRVVPALFEFWEAREFRLHERWEFQRNEDGWTRRMLYP